MKQVHHIVVSVFEKNPRNLSLIYDRLHDLLPVDFEREKIEITHEEVEGLTGDIIHILKLETRKSRHNKLVLSNIFNNLSMEEKKLIVEQRASRLNNEGYFFIRLDKPSLMEKRYVLTDSGNCFHFKIKLAAYPANPKQFMVTLEKLLSEVGCPPPEI